MIRFSVIVLLLSGCNIIDQALSEQCSNPSSSAVVEECVALGYPVPIISPDKPDEPISYTAQIQIVETLGPAGPPGAAGAAGVDTAQIQIVDTAQIQIVETLDKISIPEKNWDCTDKLDEIKRKLLVGLNKEYTKKKEDYINEKKAFKKERIDRAIEFHKRWDYPSGIIADINRSYKINTERDLRQFQADFIRNKIYISNIYGCEFTNMKELIKNMKLRNWETDSRPKALLKDTDNRPDAFLYKSGGALNGIAITNINLFLQGELVDGSIQEIMKPYFYNYHGSYGITWIRKREKGDLQHV